MSGRIDDERIARGMAAQLEAWRARLARGERRLGWKIALNAPPVQEQLAISAPVIGCMTSASDIPSGGEYSLAGGMMVGAEAEIAIHVGEDGAIDALAPAIEIVDIDLPFDDLEQILAGNVFHRGVIVGTPDRGRAGGDIDGLAVSLMRNGQEEQSADVESVLGDPADIVRLVAELLGASGEELRAGDVIISGALTPNVWPEQGDRVEAAFGPLGEVGISFT